MMNAPGSTTISGPRRRVAQVIHSLGSGGAESLLAELAGPARAAGIDIVVIGLSDADDNRTAVRLSQAGVTVYELHAARYDPLAVVKVESLLRAEQIDLVHTHLKHADLVGGIAARLAGLPVVSTLHVIEPTGHNPAVALRVKAAALARRKQFARVIAVSAAQRDWYCSIAGQCPPVELLPNGVNAAGPDTGGARERIRAELAVPPEALLAVTVSLMRPEKGHDVLLDAIRRRPDNASPIVFALAGDGPLLPEIRTAVERDQLLRDRVRVLGYRTDIDELLEAADLVVHPSHADALPTALISALAAGRPIVASAVGGIGDLIGPGPSGRECGISVPAGDPDALAAAIDVIAADPDRRRDLAAAGQDRYRADFSADVWVRRLRKLYDTVLSEQTAPTLRVISSPPSDSDSAADRQVRRAVVLSTVSLTPPDNGKSVVINGFLRHLVTRLGPAEVHYLHVGEPLSALPPELAGVRLHELGRPSRSDQVRGAVVEVGLRGRSLQEGLTSSRRVADAVERKLTELSPELIVVDTIRMAQHVVGGRTTGARQVLYLDDLFSVRYRRMLQVLRHDDSGFDPLGQFWAFVPQRLQALTHWPLTRKMLLRFEARRVSRSEIRVSQAVDLPVLLNELEARQLGAAIEAPVAVLPPLLPEPAVTRSRWNGNAEYAFVGLLSVPHNHDGLIWFLTEVFGRLLAIRPDARLHLIGRDPSPRLQEAARRWGDRVLLHGFVDDLDAAIGPMAALITPLRFGSGIKIKTLDALARGIPVVTTSIGAEGIVVDSRPGIVIADDPEEYAKSLASAADLRLHRIAAADARACYTELFAPDAAAAVYDRVLGTRPRLTSTAVSSPVTNVSGEK